MGENADLVNDYMFSSDQSFPPLKFVYLLFKWDRKFEQL